MGPFVAILAALLTFVAFWVQYEANIKQREDIATERMEAKYYKMLDIYTEMTKSLTVHGIRGKEAFAELVGEFTYTYYTLDFIFSAVISKPDYLKNKSDALRTVVDYFNSETKKKDAFLTNLAYNLFFYGKHYTIVDLEHGEITAIGEEIKRIAFSHNYQNGTKPYSDYVKSEDFRVKGLMSSYNSVLYEGHSDILGHYFRHLFQMVKYVASMNDDLVDETGKYAYVKLLRSQMSDYEQILLYFNSLSGQGRAWNTKHGERFPEDAGYISRFRMIKNIPPNFPMFGILPYDVYKEDEVKWNKLGKSFYEHKALPIGN